eukprot:5852737-Amphidinium_carterae.1
MCVLVRVHEQHACKMRWSGLSRAASSTRKTHQHTNTFTYALTLDDGKKSQVSQTEKVLPEAENYASADVLNIS